MALKDRRPPPGEGAGVNPRRGSPSSDPQSLHQRPPEGERLEFRRDPERAARMRTQAEDYARAMGWTSDPKSIVEVGDLLDAAASGIEATLRADWRRAHRGAAEQCSTFPEDMRGEFSPEAAAALARVETEQRQLAETRRRREARAARRPGRNDAKIRRIIARIDEGSALAAAGGAQ